MKSNSGFVVVGCALQSALLITSFAVSYLLAGYTLDFWGSQIKECPMTFGPLPKVGVTLVTPGIIAPAALATVIYDNVIDDNVLSGPRAQNLGLPTCD